MRRRDFFSRMIGATSLGAPILGTAGCHGDTPEQHTGTASRASQAPVAPTDADHVVTVALSELHGRDRVTLERRTQTFEIVRRADEIEVRSLHCTHWGCVVRWDPADRRYHCPCHEGLYDETGNVVAGPPLAPLRRLAAEVRGEVILVTLPDFHVPALKTAP